MALSYAAFVDVGFLKAEGARALREHGADLRPAAAEVVQWLLSLVRESLFYATWLAESYIQTEDIDEAARQAAGALLRSRRVNSARAQERITLLRRRLRPCRHVRAVQEFEELTQERTLHDPHDRDARVRPLALVHPTRQPYANATRKPPAQTQRPRRDSNSRGRGPRCPDPSTHRGIWRLPARQELRVPSGPPDGGC